MDVNRRDWTAWHRRYESDPSLGRRLRIVRALIADVVAARGAAPTTILSICSGDGRDVIGALSKERCRGASVRGRLVELDLSLAGAARRAIGEASLAGLEVLNADAGSTAAYVGAVPADLVLACGIFGNVPDSPVERTVRAMPMLCATGGAVIWTRHRRPPDLTPTIRAWFGEAGSVEATFRPIGGGFASVGCHVFDGQPAPLLVGQRLFESFHPAGSVD